MIVRFLLSSILVGGFLLGIAAPVAAQFEDPMPIEADRVRRGATASVVDSRSIQVELSGERMWDGDFTADRALETLLRIGVSHRFELRGFWAGYQRLEGPVLREGAGDTGVGVKWRWWHDGPEDGAALIGGWRFDSGDEDVGSAKGNPLLGAVWTGSRGHDYRYDINVNGVWKTRVNQSGEEETYGVYDFVLCLRRAAGYGLSTWLEFYYVFQEEKYGRRGIGGDFGVALTLGDTAMLTLAGGTGPWEQYKGWFVRAALVARAL